MHIYPIGAQLFDERRYAARFLHGDGIEIGASHLPAWVDPRVAKVRYVDRLSADQLDQLFPEHGRSQGFELVQPDIVCDVALEGLRPIADASVDFVIAFHVLEHLPNPLGTLLECYRVLKENGVLLIALPDKRRVWFDKNRQITPLRHLIDDLERDIKTVDEEHLIDFLKGARETIPDDDAARARLFEYHRERSIHVHVWTEHEMCEMFRHVIQSRNAPMELLELFLPKSIKFEVLFALRKVNLDADHAVKRFDASLSLLRERERNMEEVIRDSAPTLLKRLTRPRLFQRVLKKIGLRRSA